MKTVVLILVSAVLGGVTGYLCLALDDRLFDLGRYYTLFWKAHVVLGVFLGTLCSPVAILFLRRKRLQAVVIRMLLYTVPLALVFYFLCGLCRLFGHLSWLSNYYADRVDLLAFPLGYVVVCVLTAFLVPNEPPPAGYCGKCGYDLTGNISGVCPECGTPVDKTTP